MSFFKRGTAIALLIAVAFLVSGCIEQPPPVVVTPVPTEEPSPGAAIPPIPIPNNYLRPIQNTILAGNAFPSNFTGNYTAVVIAGTAMLNATNETKLTINRASRTIITFSGENATNSGGIAYSRATIDGVDVGATVALPMGGFTLTWVNETLATGTHNIWIQANTSAGNLNLKNTTLFVRAYPR